MKKSMAAVVLALSVAWAVNVPVSLAQENNEDKFSFGKVVSVSAQQVTVKEYDFAKDADVEMTYEVTAETEFGNVNAVTELAVDDDIVVDYTEKDGKRVITTLVKEEKGAEVPAEAVVAAEEAVPAEAVVPAQEVPAEVKQ